MIKKTLIYTVLFSLLAVAVYGQDKNKVNEETAIPTKTADDNKQTEVTKKTTAVSENTSLNESTILKEAGMLKTMFNAPATELKNSRELDGLLSKRLQIMQDLNDADKAMNELINKSKVWDKERNTEKKGHLDTILDKADRLAFSNELRMSMSSQAKVISSLISQLNVTEKDIEIQKEADEKKRKTDALKLRVELLEKEQKLLLEKIKNQQTNNVTVHSTEVVQKKREENVEYYTITEDTNLQTIALSYYQDHEKWLIIFEHPDNKKALKKKSPTAIIPIGTVLTIPKEIEE